MQSRHPFVFLGGIILLALATGAAADSIYFADGADEMLRRLDLESGKVEPLGGMAEFPVVGGIAIDGQKIYWRGYVADLDGTHQQPMDQNAMPRSVRVRLGGGAVDNAGNSYFPNQEGGHTSKILRYNSDGELLGEIPIYSGFGPPPGLAIDNMHGKIYWAGGWNNNPSGLLERADLDGSHMETLYTAADLGFEDYPVFIAVDVAHGMLYWTQNMSSIFRTPLDGGAPPQLVYTGAPIYGMALNIPEPGALLLMLPLAAVIRRRR